MLCRLSLSREHIATEGGVLGGFYNFDTLLKINLKMLYNVYFSRYYHRQTTQKWPHLVIKPSAPRHYTYAMHNG